MLKIRRPLGRLIFNMGIAIPGKTVFLIETAPWFWSEFIWARKTRSNVRRHAGDHPDTHLLVTDQSVEPRASVLCVLVSSGHPPSLSAITRMSSDEVQMKMSYMCPTSVLLLSDYLPVAPITLLLVTYHAAPSLRDKLKCVRPISDEIGRKWKIRFPTSFRPAIGLCGRGA